MSATTTSDSRREAAEGHLAAQIGRLGEELEVLRKEGKPSVRDAALSAAFGVVAGAAWELWP